MYYEVPGIYVVPVGIRTWYVRVLLLLLLLVRRLLLLLLLLLLLSLL